MLHLKEKANRRSHRLNRRKMLRSTFLLRSLPRTISTYPSTTSSPASITNPKSLNPQYSPPFPHFSTLSFPFSSTQILGRPRNSNNLYDDNDSIREPPKLRPDLVSQTKFQEDVNLASSLEEQRDGYYDSEFSEKNLPSKNCSFQSAVEANRQARKGVDLIHLKEDTMPATDNEPMDEFAADVEKVYKILRRFHSRVPKLELALQESGVVVRSGLTERVLNRCGDAGNLAYRFYVWASKQPGYRHSHDVYKAMIKNLAKMRQFGAVWALVEEMRKENPQFLSVEVFVVLMRRFASARMVKKAVEVLDEMPKYGFEPDEYVFGCLLDALCKNGSVKEAALLFEDFSMRFRPTIKHFTSLLYGWCKEGKIMEAKFVLVKMREAGIDPDVVVYNNLLYGHTVSGKMVDAFDLLQEMRRNGCEPNATSFTIVIQALCGQDKMEEAMIVLRDMERSGCEADVVTYTTLISGFCKSGKIDKGYEVLGNMIDRGFTPNETSYLYIFLAHEKKEELEECVELLEEMQKFGLVPGLGIYNTLIRLTCKLGEVKEALKFWHQIEANGISPGVDTFIILIKGFIEQGAFIDACDYFKEMVGRGLFSSPQYGTLKDLLNSLLRADKLELSKDVWSSIMTKGCDLNVYAWTIWIHALFSNGHIKEACSYCLDMMDAGLMPQPDTFAKLMRGLRKLYNRTFAAEITEKVRKMAAERHVTFKMYKRRGERDLKEKDKAKKDGRKRRSRRRRWGSSRSQAKIL